MDYLNKNWPYLLLKSWHNNPSTSLYYVYLLCRIACFKFFLQWSCIKPYSLYISSFYTHSLPRILFAERLSIITFHNTYSKEAYCIPFKVMLPCHSVYFKSPINEMLDLDIFTVFYSFVFPFKLRKQNLTISLTSKHSCAVYNI